MTTRRTGWHRRSALTLLELVVVMVVLVALAGMTLPLLNNVRPQSGIAVTMSNLRALQDVLANRYAVDMAGILPAPNASDSTRSQQPQLQFLFVNPLSYSSGAAVPYSSTSSPSTYSPTSRLGWNGPYLLPGGALYPPSPQMNPPTLNVVRPDDPLQLTWEELGFTNAYGLAGDQAVLDGWGTPIVILVDSNSSTGTTALQNAYLVSAGPNLTLNLTASTVATYAASYSLGTTSSTSNDDITLKIY